MSDTTKIAASADQMAAALQREWKVRSQQIQDAAKGRAPVALGWTTTERSRSPTRPAKNLRHGGVSVTHASSSVVAPKIVLGGVTLHARYPTVWDVGVYQSATLGSTFEGFALPEVQSVTDLIREDVAVRTGNEISDIEINASCMSSGYTRIKEAMTGDDDFCVELIAEVTAQIALDIVANSPVFASSSIRWAGALQSPAGVRVVATYDDGSTEEMTMTVGQDPAILGVGPAVLHIVMLLRKNVSETPEGEAIHEWHMIAVRTI